MSELSQEELNSAAQNLGVETQSPEQKSLMKVVKAVGDIDRLCSISNISIDEALTAFAVITSIKLAEFDRAKQVKWQKYFDSECRHQRKLQPRRGRSKEIGMKTCKKCGYTGSPKMPGINAFEVAAWLFFIPFGFFYSITKRLEKNRSTCQKCAGLMS